MLGTKRWLTIMCNYAPSGLYSQSPHPRSYVQGIVGIDGNSTYPTMSHYWRTVSNQHLLVPMETSEAWVTLPETQTELVRPSLPT